MPGKKGSQDRGYRSRDRKPNRRTAKTVSLAVDYAPLSITHKWRRLLALGCTHGIYIDPVAADAIYRMRQKWRPHTVIHLGDAIDATALRSGARFSKDKAAPIKPDVVGALEFLEAIRPTIFLAGNHENRLWALADHYNSIIAELAQHVRQEIYDTCLELKCEVIPYNILTGWREFGGVKYLHGYFYNELACRDHAETFGSCVFAHTHTTGMARGRRIDAPVAYNVGTLARIPNLDYAMYRRKTLSWAQGFVWGEYHDDKSQLWLHQNGQNLTSERWRLPIA